MIRDKAKSRKRADIPTNYSIIYDFVYGRFAKQKNYKISNKYKTSLIGDIFTSVPTEEQKILEFMARSKGNYNIKVISLNNNMTPKEIDRLYNSAIRHMYSPLNIATAVNGYYDVKKGTQLTELDFDGSVRVLRALNRSGIYYKEQLYIHLKNGWYFLWTIPGCGDISRQQILISIDSWEGRSLSGHRNKKKRKCE